jgi:hypothetical protein
MSFQLTFLGYYSIKSPQLKKQTHSVKRRNWSHRERTAQADGPRWTAPGGRGSRPPPSDGLRGRPRRPADGRQGGRPWDRRTCPDVRRTRLWTSGRVTTLGPGTTYSCFWITYTRETHDLFIQYPTNLVPRNPLENGGKTHKISSRF